MGLGNGSTSNRKYVGITDGRISLKVSEGTANAIKCQNKEGTRTWYELRYPDLSGRITSVKTRETEYGKELCIQITDDEVYELQMKIDSRYANGFFMCAPNIDPTKEVKFIPWMKVVDGQKKTNLYIYQEGKQVDWAYTREKPNGLPDLVKTKRRGKDEWDNSDRLEFQEKYLNEMFIPSVEQAVKLNPVSVKPTIVKETVSVSASHSPSESSVVEDDHDPLPF